MATHTRQALRELEYAEGEIRTLRGGLDVPIEGQPGTFPVVLGIGLQALEGYDGLVRECHADGLAGALMLLRPIIEAAILARWIEVDPPLHVEMYFADDDRELLAMTDSFKAWRRRRPPTISTPLFSKKRIRAMRAEIAATRAKARAAGEPIGEDGALMPTIQAMADRTGDSASWEAYHVLFRTVSPWTHHRGRSIAGHKIEARVDGAHLVVVHPYDGIQIRQLAAASTCHLVGTISRAGGLGIDRHARLIQDLMTLPPAPSGA